MTSDLSRTSRPFRWLRACTSALLLSFAALAGAQSSARKSAAADSFLIAVNNIAIAGEYSLRGITADFAYPVMSMITVTDDSARVVTGLADTLRWLGRGESAEIGAPIAQIWQPLQEFHRDNPSLPPDPNIYNQASGPLFTEVRKTTPFPTSTMLVMDVSGSMQEALDDAKIANHVYVDLLRPVDRAGVIQFDNRIVRLLSMTNDKAALKDTIDAAMPGGATAIYTALLRAIQETKQEVGRRRAIILYTDGFDNASDSTATVRAVIDSAQAYGIPIFTIALGDFTSEIDLKEIARQTGGLFFKSPTAKELESIYRRLSDMVQNFYMMAHASTDPLRNNSWRLVAVNVNAGSATGHGLGHYFVPGSRPADPTDLAFEFVSKTDTTVVVNDKAFNAVRPGEGYSYRLLVRNRGNAIAENVRISQFLPDSVRLTGASLPPLFTDGDSLSWHLDRIDPGGVDSIVVAVQLAAQIPNDLLELVSHGRVFASNDTSSDNNAATDTVKVIHATPPPPRADVTVFQRAQTDSFAVIGRDTVRFAAAGEVYSYQITVRNVSSVAAQNVVLTDFLPDSILASDFQPTPQLIGPDSLQWQLGNLPALGGATLRFTATVAGQMPTGTNLLINRIFVRASNEDASRRANNFSADTVYNVIKPPPASATDLALTFTSVTDTSIELDGRRVRAVKAGTPYAYHLRVTNHGPAAANGIRMRQTLPDSVRFVSSSLAPVVVQGDSLVWQMGTLAAGREDSIEVIVRLAPELPFDLDRLISQANIFAANDTTPANDTAADTAYVIFSQPPPQDVRLTVTQIAQTDSFAVSGGDTVRFAKAGETYSYLLTVKNDSEVRAHNVILTDFLPDSIRAGNFQPPPIFVSSDSLRWNLGNLSPHAQLGLRFEATVATRMPAGTNLLINKIVATADNQGPAQLDAHAASDTVYNIVRPPSGTATDLALSMVSLTDTSIVENNRTFNAVRPGEAYGYRLLLRNLGPAAAHNVRLVQVLPDSVRALGFSRPPVLMNADSLVWQIDIIEAGRADSILVAAQLAAQIPTALRELVSRASFYAANDTSTANDFAADTVKVLFAPPPPLRTDIAVFLQAQTDSFAVTGGDTVRFAAAGETYSYHITVRNLGNVAAQNLVVADFLPDSISAGDFQPPPELIAQDSLQWRLGSLAALSQTTLRFTATVAAQMPAGTNLLINRIQARADNEDEHARANNAAADTVYNVVRPPPSQATDLALNFVSVTDTNIVVNNRPVPAVKPGEEYQYRIGIMNRGPAAASNVRVTQILPDSVHFVQSMPAPQASLADSLQWQITRLEAGREEAINVTVRLATGVPQALFSLISRAGVFAANDTTASNNSARDTTYVIFSEPPQQKVRLAVRQSAQTDSFTVSGGDTLHYARAAETYSYLISVSNESETVAHNVTLRDFLPDSIRASGFEPAPARMAADSVLWHLGNLTPRARLSLRFRATVASLMPIGTNLLINTVMATADNQEPSHSGNVAIDTVYNFVPPPQPLAPEIEARPAVVNVRDSVFVRVRVSEPVSEWDLWVYLADGRIETNYADDFIAATQLAPGLWHEVTPAYTNTRLFTSAKQEPLRFEIRTVNAYGLAASDSATVTVQSSNAMVLDRNVFQADREDALAINFRLSSNRAARLDVYDLAGHHVTKLADGPFTAGWNTHRWNGVIAENGYRAGSGVYLITLRSGEYDDWKKVIIVR